MVATQSDRHYTPASLAEALVALVRAEQPTRVLDVAAGDGALLAAAAERWPAANLTGNDIDKDALERLSSRLPSSELMQVDALSNALEGVRPDVIVLNPPFSHRGGYLCSVTFAGQSIRCSPAMAFLMTATSILAEGGELVAIMPSNTRHSSKDAEAWRILESSCCVTFYGSFGRGTFEGCFPSVQFVHLLNQRPEIVTLPISPSKSLGEVAFVYRGTMPVTRASAEGDTRLLHSTDLCPRTIIRRKPILRCNSSTADLMGLFITFPRVGSFQSQHIQLRSFMEPVRMSDCLFALWSTDELRTVELHNMLVSSFEALEACYHGTCARYLTVNDLRSFLSDRKWDPHVVRPCSFKSCSTAKFRFSETL